jgi:hypothetical protein
MSGTYETSGQMSWLDTHNTTSSPVSAYGALPCGLRDGQTTVPFGRDPALASLSARQAAERGLLTSGTSGLTGTTSSASATLQQSLASKLRAATASAGSTLYRLTWKQRATPSGRQICALRASARRTSDSGSGSSGWPTPAANTYGEDLDKEMARRARLKEKHGNGNGAGMTIALAAQMAGWPTPQMRDFRSGGEDRVENPDRSNNLNDFVLMAAQIAGPARLTASGEMLIGSSAAMESGGQLNPAHSRWLMGLPIVWQMCYPSAE